MKRILIVGATSAIAQATARRLVDRGTRFALVGRDLTRLQAVAQDLVARGAAVAEPVVLDVRDLDRHEAAIAQTTHRLGGLDLALIAHGTLPDQGRCETDTQALREALEVNAVATAALAAVLANHLEAQAHGTLAVITSVAGDRGRESNYVYGAAKALVSTFLEGLRLRMRRAGVHVIDIRPGFVDTPMTAAFPKGVLWASPEQVARHIERGIRCGRKVVYAPPWWRLVLTVIRSLPDTVLYHLRL